MEEQTTPESNSEGLWTLKEVAAYLRRSTTWVADRTREGALPVVDITLIGVASRKSDDDRPRRRALLYRPESIRALVEQVEQPVAKPADAWGRRIRGAQRSA